MSGDRRRPAGAEDDPAELFAALADPTRRRVLRAVAADGPLTATALAARLPVTRQAVAKHLDVLEAAGLVRPERQGRDVRYAFDGRPLDDAVAWIAAIGARWDRRLADLRRRVEAVPPG